MKFLRPMLGGLLLFALPFAAFAGDPFFCNIQGSTLTYAKRTPSGKAERLQTLRIDSVISELDGTVRILYTDDFRKPNGRKMYGGPASLEVKADAAGNTFINIGETAAVVARGIFPDRSVSAEGGVSLLPISVREGYSLPDATCQVHCGPLTMNVSLTERVVTSIETITVPAGTFECVVVTERRQEKGLGRNVDIINRTWYAKGIGIVRHDNLSLSMKPLYSELLETVTIPAPDPLY